LRAMFWDSFRKTPSLSIVLGHSESTQGYPARGGVLGPSASNAGNEPPSKQRPQGGDVESDTLFNVAVMEALNRRRYTIPEIVEEFKPLLAVRVSFP